MMPDVLGTVGLVTGVLAALLLVDGRPWQALGAFVLSVLFGRLGSQAYEERVDRKLDR